MSQVIPASQIVGGSPGVIEVGGSGLQFSLVILTTSWRIPTGTVASFASLAAVQAFFGVAAIESTLAGYYFAGYTNSTLKPAALLFAQYPWEAPAAPYLQGGNISGLTLAQLRAISPGTLTLSINGVPYTSSSINLSTASSFSNAASTIQTALGANDASFTGVIIEETTDLTGSISGETLTVTAIGINGTIAGGSGYDGGGTHTYTAVPLTGGAGTGAQATVAVTSGVVTAVTPTSLSSWAGYAANDVLSASAADLGASGGTGFTYTLSGVAVVIGSILSGSNVTAGTQVLAQITGSAGGVGVYSVSVSQSVTSEALTATYGQLTASAITGALAVNQIVAGSGVTAGTTITANLGTNVWAVLPTQAVGSGAMTSGAATVAYDSVSGAFVITGGTPGSGTIGYAAGAIATSLLLTQATGAVLSQGAPIATPAAFMTALEAVTRNFFSLMTVFDLNTADKVALAGYVNGQAQILSGKLIYWEWAQEIANAEPDPTLATAQIIAAGYSGTAPLYAPVSTNIQAAAAAGMIASIDFTQPNGRENFAFLSQVGLPVEVTNGATAEQLKANGFNFYGTWGTRANDFTFFYPGSITGPYNWIDSYYCAASLEDQLQVAQMDLLTTIGSIPFTPSGAETIYNALAAGPIAAALAFGAINVGVELSEAQIAATTAAAGLNISSTLETQGWYLQVNVPAASVRATRGPWPVKLWYCDGGSVISLDINPYAVQ